MTREELYALVWSKPMQHVASTFGVSGSYLARVCSILKVPRPERGYWARAAVGDGSPVMPLPEAEPGHSLEWSKATGFGPAAAALPDPRQEFKKFPRLLTKTAVSETHVLIAGARKHFENSRPHDRVFPRYGEQYLRPYKKILVDMTVTKSALIKGLSLANALFNAFESVGYHLVIATSLSLHHRDADHREMPSKRPQAAFPARWKPRDPTVVYVEGAAIGLSVVEMSEEVLLRYLGSGSYIRDSDYRPPKRGHLQDHSWTTTEDVPTGRFRVVAYSPYDRVTWSTQWQESNKESSLLDQIPSIVSALKGVAAELERRKQESDAAYACQVREWEAQEERRVRADDLARIEASHRASADLLEEAISAWVRATNRETFFRRLEERSAALPTKEQADLCERLALARSFAGTLDPVEHFLNWKAPSEIYKPRYAQRDDREGASEERSQDYHKARIVRLPGQE